MAMSIEPYNSKRLIKHYFHCAWRVLIFYLDLCFGWGTSKFGENNFGINISCISVFLCMLSQSSRTSRSTQSLLVCSLIHMLRYRSREYIASSVY